MISDSLRGRSLQMMWTYEGPASLVNLFFTHYSFLASRTVHDHIIGIRLGALEMCYILVLWVYPQGLLENESHELTWLWLVGLWFFVHMRGYLSSQVHHLISILWLLLLWLNFLCQVGSANGNPSGSLFGESFKKILLGGMEKYRRRLFRRTRICGFPCARTEHRQQRLHTWWCTSSTGTSGAAWFSSLGTYWAPG